MLAVRGSTLRLRAQPVLDGHVLHLIADPG